jgi:hypothetical protein
MDAMVRLASRTALEVLHGVSPLLRDRVHSLMSKTGIFDDEVEQSLNAWLSRSHTLRDFDYGESSFTRRTDRSTVLPPDEYDRLKKG